MWVNPFPSNSSHTTPTNQTPLKILLGKWTKGNLKWLFVTNPSHWLGDGQLPIKALAKVCRINEGHPFSWPATASSITLLSCYVTCSTAIIHYNLNIKLNSQTAKQNNMSYIYIYIPIAFDISIIQHILRTLMRYILLLLYKISHSIKWIITISLWDFIYIYIRKVNHAI